MNFFGCKAKRERKWGGSQRHLQMEKGEVEKEKEEEEESYFSSSSSFFLLPSLHNLGK